MRNQGAPTGAKGQKEAKCLSLFWGGSPRLRWYSADFCSAGAQYRTQEAYNMMVLIKLYCK